MNLETPQSALVDLLQLRYLELLKLRFGESHLHFCEIMLKDIADSRRINAHIQSEAAKNGQPEVSTELVARCLTAICFWAHTNNVIF